ncbi:glycoside hydrolase [Paramyrothecium foliicola]|nr:glycoside hydrolase [Paramyrothecium foliicola]
MFHSLGRLALCTGPAWLSFVDTVGAQYMLQGKRVSRPRDTSPITILSNKKPWDNGLERGRCTKDIECSNYACCNGRTRECLYDPEDHCYQDNCWSNCDTKAECGRFTEIPEVECTIHVCCGMWGLLRHDGTLKDFCTDVCQSNCFEVEKRDPNESNVEKIIIGYVKGWDFTRRGCAQRKLDHNRVDSITHLFASFAHIKPKSFEVYPMPGVADGNILRLVSLKKKAPGLKVWVAIGGSAEKRNKFISQLEKFMIPYGFDGK